MPKTVKLAEAKAKFSAIVDDVLHGSGPYVIERRGRPVAAVVSIAELEKLQRHRAGEEPDPLLALAGLWGDIMTNEEIDDFVKDIYEARARDLGRPVDLSEV